MKWNEPPMFLEARSPQELRLLMLANNRRFGVKFHYFDFQFANRKWYCWFELSEKDRVMKNEPQRR